MNIIRTQKACEESCKSTQSAFDKCQVALPEPIHNPSQFGFPEYHHHHHHPRGAPRIIALSRLNLQIAVNLLTVITLCHAFPHPPTQTDTFNGNAAWRAVYSCDGIERTNVRPSHLNLSSQFGAFLGNPDLDYDNFGPTGYRRQQQEMI